MGEFSETVIPVLFLSIRPFRPFWVGKHKWLKSSLSFICMIFSTLEIKFLWSLSIFGSETFLKP
jgi:hypothetical protein